jgi:hypothetical protein
MSTSAHAPARSEQVALRRLLWVGPLAVLASVVANLIFTMIGNQLLGVSPEFPALTPGAIAVFTAVGVLAAVVVFALVARFARRPIWLFRRIALVALLLSFIPDLALPFMPGPDPVGAREVVLLALTHVVAAVVSVALLTTLARRPSR